MTLTDAAGHDATASVAPASTKTAGSSNSPSDDEQEIMKMLDQLERACRALEEPTQPSATFITESEARRRQV